ncbi:MAG: ABC transporter permease [Bacilli bacterium]|nr:ABC transporter permease [Christensenellaceae bacterium]MDD6361288.1 ABC transporter permease [Christensenellaceae bacterium]MDD7315373.1 ABC transporter permease [Bacilli bacterium]MDY4709395.1 ABC transporter permease [Eubacteriales bacterium]
MARYIAKRLLYILLVFILISFLMYLIYNAIPFDRARWLADEQKEAYKYDPEGLEQLYQEKRTELGLDKNIVERYLMWLGVMPLNGKYNGMLQGNFGVSYTNIQQPVVEVLKEPMKNTIFINVFATVLALGITIPLGILCAVKKGTKLDTGVQVGSIIGYSMPTFITAILFIFIFAISFGWFPVSGQETPGSTLTGAARFFDRLYYMALPLIVMTFCSLGGMTRYVRASMIEALSMDCIRTARAKGLKERTVIFSHAWRNALIPIVTLVIGWFLGIFSGSIMIENIFGLNGMGRMYIISLNNNDFDVVLTLQMFYVIIGLVGNLVIDLIYGLVDPRIRINK